MSEESAKNANRSKKVHDADLVYGLGKSGLSAARFLKRMQRKTAFTDSREQPPGLDELMALMPGASVVLGEPPADFLHGFSRMIVSPGIADDDGLLEAARVAGIEIVSDIELFVAAVSAPFVAVTGSNGKSTVATLLHLMCEADGMSALAGANLGEPALDMLAMDAPELYILELSSFQLARTAKLPASVAVLLNISPDHLDWHGSEEDYRAAKYRVFADADAAVWNRADEESCRHIPEAVPRLSFGLDAPSGDDFGIVEEGGVAYLAKGDQLLLASDDLVLVGKHNQANALAALAAGELVGLTMPAMLQVLLEFPGLRHRMQFVSKISGVDYINDSKATNVGAAIASVDSVPGFVVLIAGGQGKGGDFESLANAVHLKLRAAILIGEDASLIARALGSRVAVHTAANMHAAVARAAEIAEHGDTVLLAPACASFDQYENFQQRGDDFCHAVEALAA